MCFQCFSAGARMVKMASYRGALLVGGTRMRHVFNSIMLRFRKPPSQHRCDCVHLQEPSDVSHRQCFGFTLSYLPHFIFPCARSKRSQKHIPLCAPIYNAKTCCTARCMVFAVIPSAKGDFTIIYVASQVRSKEALVRTERLAEMNHL